MRLTKKILPLLDIRPEEGRLVAAMMGHFFLIAVGRMFVFAAAYGLFLAQFDSKTLPFVYIAVSIVATLTSVVYLRLGARLDFKKLLVINLGFVLAVTLATRLGLAAGPSRWLIFALPVWYDVMWILTNISFWGLAGRLFDVRQGKRLFGLITSGKLAGDILSGIAVPFAVGLVGAANLLLVAAAFLAATLVSLLAIVRAFGAGLASTGEQTGGETETEDEEPLGQILKRRYVLLLFGQIVLGWIVFYALDNIFYDRASARFPDADELAGFLGVFLAVISLVSLLVSVFATSTILRRFGVGVAILIWPGSLALITAAIVGAGLLSAGTATLFWLAATARLLASAFYFATDVPATNILYQPLAPKTRARVQTMAEGIVFPVAAGVAGLLLILLRSILGLDVFQLAGILLVLLAGWLSLSFLLGREYPGMLKKALAKRGLTGATLDVLDRSSIDILHQALHSSHPEQVVYALNLLEGLAQEDLQQPLIELLEHPDPRVRQDVLARIERHRMTAALAPIRKRIAVEESAPVRARCCEP